MNPLPRYRLLDGAPPNSDIAASGDQLVYLPNASVGGTARLRTIPVKAQPATGDVEITVDDPTATNPIFAVDYGDTIGDSVTFVYADSQMTTGETYVLDSITAGITQASKEASSPVSLEDDDSPETLEIYEENETTSDGGGGGGGGGGGVGGPISSGQEGPIAPVSIVLLAALLGIIGVAFVGDRYIETRVVTIGLTAGTVAIEIFVITEVLFPGRFTVPAARAVAELAPLFALAAFVLLSWGFYVRIIEPVLQDQNKTISGQTVEVVVRREGSRWSSCWRWPAPSSGRSRTRSGSASRAWRSCSLSSPSRAGK